MRTARDVTATPPAAGGAGAPVGRTARALALAAFLLYAFTGGGRIVGSDEVTMFELSRALLHGRIEVPEGATVDAPDGRHHTKNAAAQAIAALPLTAVSQALSAAVKLPEPRRTLAMRFGVSCFNAIVTAFLLGAFYAAARALGAGARASFAGAVLLGFTTPLWVYAKSFMAEPLEALGLLLALTGAARAAAGTPRADRIAALGVLLAVSAKLSMLPLAIAALLPLIAGRTRALRLPLIALAAALAGHGLYDLARFGNVFETGYGAQATPAAYTTPLLVGLYGLLLSSGKGVLWFAPALWLVPAGWKAMTAVRAGTPPDARGRMRTTPATGAAWGAAATWIPGLLLYARFQHWAGDGSYGPRYLVPLLPLAFLPVAFALDPTRAARRRLAWVLALLGLVVQIGGVGIYFGAQMREAGDYPYPLPLDHPRFMSDSHFNPAFSPMAGHWRMLARNLGEHARGEMPRLSGGGVADPRLGVGSADQERLLHAIDLWWLYLLYAGFPAVAVLGAAGVLLAAALWALARARAALAAEIRAG